MSRAPTPKTNVTKNYRLFKLSDDNRPLDIKRHKKLRESMQKYGFRPWCPVICVRDKKGDLIVRDGQHRLAIAETLGLEVYWQEVAEAFDIAEHNATPIAWKIRDFADNFAKKGLPAYAELVEFSDRHGISISRSAILLSGVASFSAVSKAFYAGEMKIASRQTATEIATVFTAICAHDIKLQSERLLDALIAASRLPEFSMKQLLSNLERCTDRIKQYSSRDGFLEMLEEIYNFHQKKLFPLKINAIQIMRDRNPVLTAKAAKAAK